MKSARSWRGSLFWILVLGLVTAGLVLQLRSGSRTRAGGAGGDGSAGRDAAAPETLPDAESAPDGSSGPEPSLAEPAAAGGAAGEEAAAEDPVRCVVFGRVTDAAGEPIPGWEPYVVLTDPEGERVGVQVGASGHYSIAGVAPGAWSLRCGAVGYRDSSQDLDLSLSDPIVRRDLVLERTVALRIRVLAPGGQPLSEALRATGARPIALLPVATLEPPGPTMAAALGIHNDTLGVGAFWDHGPPVEDLDPDCLGVLVLEHGLPVHVSLVSGSEVLETQRVEPGTAEVTFVVDPDAARASLGTVRFRVVDAESRNPLAGNVTYGNASMQVTGGPLAEDGSKWLEGLAPGAYELMIFAAGYELLPREFELRSGEVLDLGEIALVREVVIEGRVVDAEGQPVMASFVLGWFDPGGGKLRFRNRWVYRSEPDGRIEFRGLRPDRYVLRTEADDEQETAWVSGNIEVSTLGGTVKDLEIRLVKPGVLRLRGTKSLPEGAGFRLLDERGYVLRSARFYEGRVPQARVPPGSYTLVLFGAEREELRRETIQIEETTELDVSR